MARLGPGTAHNLEMSVTLNHVHFDGEGPEIRCMTSAFQQIWQNSGYIFTLTRPRGTRWTEVPVTSYLEVRIREMKSVLSLVHLPGRTQR